jgi:type II secretory pathway predicted ATPase ExeA
MVNQFFGLREQPFGVTPDPRYLYLGPGHREALASLVYGIEANRGFLALIAQPGMGKTTLLVHLLEKFRQSSRTAFLFQTQCNSRELVRFLLAELGIEGKENDLVRMHDQFNRFLLEQSLANKRVIVVIDEAQNLEPSVLETVRLLSNFETPRAKLLQIILSGQPELATKLASPSLSQFRQRIASFNGLKPLPPQEVARFIDHRLKVARYQGPPLFTDEAKAMIARLSEGIPRNINSLCFGALSLACGVHRKTVDREIVQEVFGDHDLRNLTSNSETVAVHHHFATWSSQWEEPKIAWSSQSPLRAADASPPPAEVARLSDTRRDPDRGSHDGHAAIGPEEHKHKSTRPLQPLSEAPLRGAEARPTRTEVFALSATNGDRDRNNHEGDRKNGPEGHAATRPLRSLPQAPLRPAEASPMPTEAVAFSGIRRDLDESNARCDGDGDGTSGSEDHNATRPLRRKLLFSLLLRAVVFAVLILMVGSGVTKVAAPAVEMANTAPLPSRESQSFRAIVKIADAERVRPAPMKAQPSDLRNPTTDPAELSKGVNEASANQKTKRAAPIAAIAEPLSRPENMAALGVVKVSDTEAVKPLPAKTHPEPAQHSALDPAELWKRVAQGNISAEISLATLYLDGSATVEQNCEQAHQLLMVASRTGSKGASDLLNGRYAERCHGPQP